jgi:hypothetical protein
MKDAGRVKEGSRGLEGWKRVREQRTYKLTACGWTSCVSQDPGQAVVAIANGGGKWPSRKTERRAMYMGGEACRYVGVTCESVLFRCNGG